MTKPRDYAELKGLVYSLTPKEDFHDDESHTLAWYQKPTLLAGIALAMVVGLNAVFW